MRHNITARSIILGLLLIPLNSFFIVRLERVLFGPYPSTISLFANAVFALFILVGANRWMQRFSPRFQFSQGELLTIYTMLAISTGLAGLDGIPNFNQIVGHGAWFGSQNHWEGFLKSFPPWLVVRDHDVLQGHYLGHSTFYRPEVLRAWLPPVLCWTLFITLLLWTANCINILVRRQWADHERLTFPIIWLPIAMVENGIGTAFFANQLMWAGFAVAAGLGLWNGIAFLFPALPSLPIGITDLKPLLTTKPWSAIDWFPVTFYPMVIGLGFLLPLDLLFSCWFFFLFWKAQMVLSNAFAWDATPDFPFIKEQGFGALIGLFLVYLWTGRRTYAAIWRRALGRASTVGPNDSAPNPAGNVPEALSDRAALLGIAFGLTGLMIFCLAAGVTWWVAALFFAIFIPTITVITRIRAELGPPVHDFHFMGPDNMIPRALSAHPLTQHDMAFFTFSFAFTRAHRSDTMPAGLEGLQMARLRQLEGRRMLIAIMLAVIVGTVCAFWAFEHQSYTLGAASHFAQGTGFSGEAYGRMNAWVGGTQNPHPNFMAVSAMSIGLFTTGVLTLLRLRFWLFPFHPIGYAISSSWSIHLVWMPLIIAWVFKSLAMRFGGLHAYRRLLPFFLGLILGDCVMGTLWGLVSLAFNIRTYNFFGA